MNIFSVIKRIDENELRLIRDSNFKKRRISKFMKKSNQEIIQGITKKVFKRIKDMKLEKSIKAPYLFFA